MMMLYFYILLLLIFSGISLGIAIFMGMKITGQPAIGIIYGIIVCGGIFIGATIANKL